MKFRDVRQTGSRGNIVSSRNRSGPYQRERVTPDQPASAAQCAAWGNMSDVSRLWNLLQQEQLVEWDRLAEGLHSRPNLGISGKLSGCQLFKKLNRVLATCHRPPLMDPPPLPVFADNPVHGFEIRQVRGRMALILKVSSRIRWKARPVLEDVMVHGWAPCNAGTKKNSLYAFLGLLPAPINGETDITEMFLRKLKEWRKLRSKRYHVPLPGSKIFIRVWQQVNGWVNELGVFKASDLVRVSDESRSRELAELLSRWPTRPRHQ